MGLLYTVARWELSSQLFWLNSASSRKSEEFNLKDIEMLVDRKVQHWFKRTYVKKLLVLVYIHKSTAKLGDEDQKFQAFVQADGAFHSMTSWFGPKYYQNKEDNFSSVTSTLYVIVNSGSDKGKELKKYILKDILPRGFDGRIAEIQKKISPAGNSVPVSHPGTK